MKSQVTLLKHIIHEYGMICGTRTDKDVEYILRRWKMEGDSFLTITLPTFDKGLLKSLDEGVAVPSHWPAFGARGGLPQFLGGFLRNIFFPNGSVRPTTPEVVSNIRAIRQITLVLGKIFMVAPEHRVQAAMKSYVEVDREIPDIPETLLAEFERTSNQYFGDYLQSVENRLWDTFPQTGPTHSSGAVANRLSQNGKWSANVWTDRLEAVFPAYEFLLTGPTDYLESPLSYLSEDQEPPVRVIPVPKTMKTPRIIAMEPSWMMYVQQGILAVMEEELANHPFVNATMGWLDQEPNRQLCRDWRGYATLDLSEASDRVPLQLVSRMLDRYPLLQAAVLASRSQTAELPDGTLVRLKKFASMGSAMCFPFESLCFAVVTLMGNARISNPITPGTLPVRKFRVYGDDIITPIDSVPSVLNALESFGFKVNSSKSFWTGRFRESCGKDWYDGYDVSIVRVRHPFPENRQNGVAVLKVIDLHNRLFESGLWESAKYLENLICEIGFPYYAPIGHFSYAMWTLDDSKVRYRLSPVTHQFEIRSVVPRISVAEDELSGYGALRKFFRKRPRKRPLPENHLNRSGRSQRVAIHAGWSRLHQTVAS